MHTRQPVWHGSSLILQDHFHTFVVSAPPPTFLPIPFHCAVYFQRHITCRVSRSCIDICFFFFHFKVYLHSGVRERRTIVGEKEGGLAEPARLPRPLHHPPVFSRLRLPRVDLCIMHNDCKKTVNLHFLRSVLTGEDEKTGMCLGFACTHPHVGRG